MELMGSRIENVSSETWRYVFFRHKMSHWGQAHKRDRSFCVDLHSIMIKYLKKLR